ncbi:unnamed protein product, partial [Prorocentrum cordatum]
DSVRQRVGRLVSSAGDAPADLKPHDALQELLRVKDLYTVEPSHLGSFDVERVKVLSAGVSVMDMEDLLPPDQRAMLADPEGQILRNSSELEYDSGAFAPYWGPKLRFDTSERRRLILRLAELGLVGFRTSIRARIGIFVVKKKDGFQRLIVDAREPNRLCRRPPHSWLDTVTALTGVDLSDSAIRATSQDDGDLSWVQPSAGCVDLYSGFYQFRNRRMGSLFGIDFGASLAVRLPYVDNANVIGITAESTQRALEHVKRDFDAKHLDFHEENAASPELQLLGVVFDGVRRQIRPLPRRTWRLHLALQEVIRRGFASGRVVQILVGHLVHHFQLARAALASLDKVWAFIGEHYDDEAELWDSVRWELEVAGWLVFMAGVDLGYALHVAEISDAEYREVAAYRERWRFDLVERESAGWGPALPWAAAWRAQHGAGASPQLGHLESGGGASQGRRRPWRQLDEIERPASVVGIPALPDALVDPARWRRVVRGGWKYDTAIHEKEGRVMLMGLVRASREVRFHGCRLLSIGDNLACICSFEKGRAKSYCLHRLCQRAGALTIACGLIWTQRYLETK